MYVFRKCRIFLICACAAALASQVVMAAKTQKDVDPRFLWSKFGVSPDGKQIAYPLPVYDTYSDTATQIWVSNLDGTKKRRVASVSDIQGVEWLDNSQLVCTKSHSNTFQIVSLNGKQRKVLLPETNEVCWPVISPDGKWIAVSTYNSKLDKMGIFLFNIKSGTLKTLATGVVKRFVSWSPDSKKIAYGEGDYQKDYKLIIVDVQTGEVSDTGKLGVGADWSPNGRLLAYSGNVVKGGSWMDGVPVDSSIVIMNTATKETKTITPAAVNNYDAKTGHWEISGAILPLWSPDGSKIAYRKKYSIVDNNNSSLDEDQIWVINADGSKPRKLIDKWSPFVWSPDSKAILVKTASGIDRVAADTGKSKSLIAWKTPIAPEMSEQTIGYGGSEAKFKGVKLEYAKALLTIAVEANHVYADTFGFDMPKKLTLNIEKTPNGRTQLWTDGDSQMFLNLKSSEDLAPPTQSGVYNIYGMCHELGHMAMYRSIKMIGLPEGVGEGWAHYAGSVVVDHVYKKLGKNIWPQPYNYSEVEGIARLAKSASNADAEKDPTIRAALVFYKAQQQYGEDKVMTAMKDALQGEPMGKDVMPDFANALVKITNDASARAFVPDEFLNPKVNWKSSEREINEKTTQGQMQVPDQAGLWLKYDDGNSSDRDRLSSAGAGHAVIFYAPDGSWAVDSIQLYGSRYGEAEPPKDNFSIFICDQDFNVIKTIEKPYATFDTGEPKWYTMSFDLVKVPRGFYVCVYFAPTANKGVYVYYDTDVAMSHSRSALPWTFVYDVQGKYDWMIRSHLVKAD